MRAREAHWLLETEETALGAVEAVRAYQELWRVEAAFRSMKDVLELRPIWHRTDERVPHVLVAALALTFDRILQRKLEKAGLPRAAWAALEVSLVESRCIHPVKRGAQGGGKTPPTESN